MFGHVSVKTRVSELENALAKALGEIKSLRMEWEDAYEKLARMMGRISKRAASLEKAEAEEPVPVNGDAPLHSTGGRMLSPRQLTIQQQILQRRGGRQ